MAQPVVNNNAIFFIDARSIVYSYDLEDRKLIWKRAVAKINEDNHNIGGGIALHNKKVFVNSPYGEVVAFDMQNGNIVESGSTSEVFNSPKHQYTQKLLSAEPQPKINIKLKEDPLIEIKNLDVFYEMPSINFFKKNRYHAVKHTS